MRNRSNEAVYMIGTVARMYNIHPQTLRLYEREGLLVPSRTKGNTRMYSEEDLKRLEFILFLTRELGINLAGVEVVLKMKEQIEDLQKQIEFIVSYLREEVKNRYTDDIEKQREALVHIPKIEIMKIEEYIYNKYKKGR